MLFLHNFIYMAHALTCGTIEDFPRFNLCKAFSAVLNTPNTIHVSSIHSSIYRADILQLLLITLQKMTSLHKHILDPQQQRHFEDVPSRV